MNKHFSSYLRAHVCLIITMRPTILEQKKNRIILSQHINHSFKIFDKPLVSTESKVFQI